MKSPYCFMIILQFLYLSGVKGFEVVCHLDTYNTIKLSSSNIDDALGHCTHFVYGYATLEPKFFTLTFDGAVQRSPPLNAMSLLKKKYPHIRFLLGMGGNRDNRDPQKYLQLLEAPYSSQMEFIKSSLYLLKNNDFDGLDLGFQLPSSEPMQPSTGLIQFWRKLFHRQSNSNSELSKYKQLFSRFVTNLSSVYKTEKKLLTLSVLPNVNVNLFFDIPIVARNFDFITLWAFDYHTPQRYPKIGDYPAPLMRPPHYSDSFDYVEYTLNLWLSPLISTSKIILAIPGHARSWKMSSRSPRSGLPAITHSHGPARYGALTQTPGLLSWPEVCDLIKEKHLEIQGSLAYGEYVVYPPHDNSTHSAWIAFDGPNVAQFKSHYAISRKLGGVALMDLSMDDAQGECTGVKFPILKYINRVFS